MIASAVGHFSSFFRQTDKMSEQTNACRVHKAYVMEQKNDGAVPFEI